MKITVVNKLETKAGTLAIGTPFVCKDRLYMVAISAGGDREVVDLQAGVCFPESKLDNLTIRTDVKAEIVVERLP